MKLEKIFRDRTVGAPGWAELGLGAVAETGEVFIDAQTVRQMGATDAEVKAEVARKQSVALGSRRSPTVS